MMGKKPRKTDWNRINNDEKGYFYTAKSQLLNNPGKFIKDMREYDKEHMEEKMVRRVNAILESDDFTIEKVRRASEVLRAIMIWSKAMITYHNLLKTVNPKRIKLMEMTDEL